MVHPSLCCPSFRPAGIAVAQRAVLFPCSSREQILERLFEIVDIPIVTVRRHYAGCVDFRYHKNSTVKQFSFRYSLESVNFWLIELLIQHIYPDLSQIPLGTTDNTADSPYLCIQLRYAPCFG
jgi:hypothetical protein